MTAPMWYTPRVGARCHISAIGRRKSRSATSSEHFIVDEEKMAKTNNALVSHCLPMRRNVKMTDAVFDSDNCFAYDEAENRLHVQKAIMKALVS